MTPTLIVTRPIAQAARFADDVKTAWGRPLHVILSPVLRIVPVAAVVPPVDAVVFTSANAVNAASALGLPRGMAAWCVGAKTAALAKQAGFEPETGPGDADGLVRDIIAAQPIGRIAHIRGTHTRGDLCARLQSTGLDCIEVITYDQVACAPSAQALNALNGANPVVLPLFSPRTSTILSQEGPFAGSINVVAMSDAVKDQIDPALNWHVTVADRPDAAAMIDALVEELTRLAR